MLRGVEHFFRGFGGELKPLHQVWKYNSPLLRLLKRG
jgi:hypothetical protein